MECRSLTGKDGGEKYGSKGDFQTALLQSIQCIIGCAHKLHFEIICKDGVRFQCCYMIGVITLQTDPDLRIVCGSDIFAASMHRGLRRTRFAELNFVHTPNPIGRRHFKNRIAPLQAIYKVQSATRANLPAASHPLLTGHPMRREGG